MPIAMSAAELARIRRWTDSDREDPELVRRRELVRLQDETSRNMTKTWPNSLENVNKRNEEIRQARIQVAEQANATFYKKYVRRRKEEQERLMYSARDTVFKNKDAPKLMLSAVIETCVQKERMEQIKFMNERRREAAERKRKEDEETIQKAKEWERMKEEQRRLRYEADKKHQMEILDQAHEISERNRMEYESELNMQQIDNLKADQQMAAIKEFDEKFKASEKARIWADMSQARREAEQRRDELRARDRMDDALISVLTRSQARVQARTLRTQKQVRDEKQRVLDQISARLVSGDAARDAKEQEMLDKAKREKDEAEKARRMQQAQKLADIKAERLEQRAQWRRDEAQRLHALDTQLQWDIMNRFKNTEVYEDFKEKMRQEKARKIKEYREDILRLWKERSEREANELAESRRFYGELALQKLRAADNKFLTHAGELLREARAHGRPDYALRHALDRYCQLYRLYPMPDLPRSMAEHFPGYSPADGSEPDPGYVEPLRPAQTTEKPAAPVNKPAAPANKPPAPAKKPAEPVDKPAASDDKPAVDSEKRDGLQDPPQSFPLKPASEKTKKEENVADYKRAGKANGLQRKNAEIDIHLPQILPCKNEACSCELKQSP